MAQEEVLNNRVISDIAERIARKRKSKKCVLVSIAGGSCSGKTYLSDSLSKRIVQLGERVSLIILDNYFRDIDDQEFPRNSSGKRLFDVPDSYHQIEFTDHICKLLSGKDIQMPDYDTPTNKRLSNHGEIVRSTSIIIAEGLFAISMLNGLYPHAIKIYVDTDQSICLKRRVKRDTVRYGISKEKVEEIFNLKVLPYHQQFVLPQKLLADIVIQNNSKGGE